MQHNYFWLIGQRDGKASTGVVIVPLGAERWVMFPSRTFVHKSLVLFVCPLALCQALFFVLPRLKGWIVQKLFCSY